MLSHLLYLKLVRSPRDKIKMKIFTRFILDVTPAGSFYLKKQDNAVSDDGDTGDGYGSLRMSLFPTINENREMPPNKLRKWLAEASRGRGMSAVELSLDLSYTPNSVLPHYFGQKNDDAFPASHRGSPVRL